MRGYAKIKENKSFSQISRSKNDYPFFDQDFNDCLDIYSSKTQENELKPNIIEDEKSKKIDIFPGKSKEYDDDDDDQDQHQQEQVKNGGVLRRNFTVSSSTTSLGYQKNGKSNNLERQSSTRAIQETVKRAFSMRRSSSVNSDRYCRIYDQPKNVKDCDSNYDYGNNGSFNHHQEDDDEYEFESMGMTKNMDDYYSCNNGKRNVGSKVVKACKRLFSR